MSMTLKEVEDAACARLPYFHGDAGIKDWSTMEWAGAMAGEAGEACNVTKKIRRVDSNHQRRKHTHTREELVEMLGEELADTLCYLVITAKREGIDLNAAFIKKYNQVSQENDIPIILCGGGPIRLKGKESTKI